MVPLIAERIFRGLFTTEPSPRSNEAWEGEGGGGGWEGGRGWGRGEGAGRGGGGHWANLFEKTAPMLPQTSN